MTTTNLSVVGSGPMWAPVEVEVVWVRNKIHAHLAERKKRVSLAWITSFKQMFDECCFPSGVLTQKHNHWFGIKIAIALKNKTSWD